MADDVTISRTGSSDLTRQVLLEGDWHRRMPDLSATACGISLHSQFCVPRPECLVHPLCRICFTLAERSRADEHQRKEREETT